MSGPPATAPADAEIVRRCLSGEQAAWSELVERYNRYVYAICTQAYRLSPHDSEDVFQETFARVYEHLGRLKDPDALRPWIGQVTRRLCVDRIRSSGREVVSEDLEPVEADETIARLDEALGVHQALSGLPEHCQEVLDRFFCRDQSYHEIGEALSIPSGTIASRISRCLVRLRAIYSA
ncbi:RNA polymerase sigma factor [Miltoncostaea oceani]|uniref:RNA polymerase sigma factor n=1 Tax=Miltoncostaea oceani TaxID=2843216 RepID=UPI001C3CB889|nr:sigma-70 family RNA polymerase sigma factor [Miltoncostaea oceani]